MNGGAGVWLVLPDQLSIRLFFDSGIVRGLRARLGDFLAAGFVGDGAQWAGGSGGVEVLDVDALLRSSTGRAEKVRRRLDGWLDARAGYYPLAIRLNERHGFHRERMEPGHENWMLDSA
ncbi:MAG TPA: hypothetical protein VLA69_06630, partial [Gaiellaceae bacterium]|nr:hypothetical protein [Gaiellaceae bacterium]